MQKLQKLKLEFQQAQNTQRVVEKEENTIQNCKTE
jgi:hypothetical protein